jgi:hypothetical protein
MYATNTTLREEEKEVIKQVGHIMQSAMMQYHARGFCYNCCSILCCPCLTDSENAQKIKSLSRGIGVIPEIQFVGYMIHAVRFIFPSREITGAMEEITMIYNEGRWTYQGVPDEQSLKIRDEMNWTFFPQHQFCFTFIQPFWPTTLIECLFSLIIPWVGASLLLDCAIYIGCTITSPCWSCCSALRFKEEWIENPKITRANVLLTTKSVELKCPGYKYQPITPEAAAAPPPAPTPSA